ncbi:MAG: AGE family epimerase/isomerase [Neisseria sp.]|nr:AGE family epimerase/isomerase [Neisseria sp.]
MINALQRPEHQDWLLHQAKALLEFARKARQPMGFAYLDKNGEVDFSQPVQAWISCRMTHIYSIGALMGVAGCRDLAEHGIRSLLEYFQDPQYGGFFEAVEHRPDANGHAVPAGEDGRKTAYAHAFVLLAASSGLIAGVARADELFDNISEVIDRHFWEAESGKMRESFSRDFSECEAYRGVNANMHTVEASLAAFDAQLSLGVAAHDERAARWLRRANSIIGFVFDLARQHDYRIPEHFDADWQILWDYNANDKAHQFRPYGATVGHALEWARLGCHALAMNRRYGVELAADYARDAYGLFRQSLNNWHGDGAAGFVYTTDFEGNPIVRERMHWVLCEGIGAAVALDGVDAADAPLGGLGLAQGYVASGLGNEFSYWYELFVAYADEYLIEAPGKWYHQLDTENRPADGIWAGKPDIYHAFQVLMLPLLPFGEFITKAVKESSFHR